MQSVDDQVFTLTTEDVQAVAEDYLGRELTDDELDMFCHKFDIHDWYDYVVCHFQALNFDKE
jgi:hypothetical protein